MKITDRYKKMALKAEEIQRRWDGRYCSWVWVPHRNWTGLKQNAHEMSDNCVWLPTQEQLQRMLTRQDIFHYGVLNPYKPPRVDNLLSLFCQFSNRHPEFGKAEEPRVTINELWLAFVMKMKYGKVWNDEKQEWEECP